MFARFLGVLAVAGTLVASASASATDQGSGTLEHIRRTQTIRIAYREDAPPFSFKDSLGEPAGFMVGLCKAVAEGIRQQLGLPAMKLDYVAVHADDRFAAITQGRADLLCEPTSATLSRREQMDFSIPTFVDGAGLAIRTDAGIDPRQPRALAGKRVGFLAGTTTEQEVRKAVQTADITVDLVPVKSHLDGIAMLESGKIDAYFADRSILLGLLLESKATGNLKLLDRYYSVEPYALALPHGDEDFRLAVDRALSHLYRSGEVAGIFKQAFGNTVDPSPTLVTLYLISGLPD